MPDIHKKTADPRGEKYLKRTMKALYKIMGYKNYKGCENYWYKNLKNCNLNTSFKKIGITKS